MPRVVVKGAFTRKLHLSLKERQSDHLTALQGGHDIWNGLQLRQTKPAKIIGHNVQCRKVGTQIDQEESSFSCVLV